MKINLPMKMLFLLLVMLVVNLGFSQNNNKEIWTEVSKSSFKQTTQASIPLKAKAYKLDLEKVKLQLSTAPKRGEILPANSKVILSFPNSIGVFESYRIIEASVMSPELQAQFPNIRSYAGQGIDNPSSTIRFSVSDTKGISSMRRAEGMITSFIEMYSNQEGVYVAFDRSSTTKSDFACDTDEQFGKKMKGNVANASKDADTGTFHTFRLALSCTGEYGAGAGGGTEAGVMTEFNNTMTRVNGIFENDFATTMVMITNESDIIHLNPATDPYTGALNGELQAHLTAVIGEANYDIGHVFSQAGNNGNAGCIGCICVDGSKGSAFTQSTVPTGVNFDVDFVAHEMGHQFGGNHTFTHNNEGTGANLEPGSGSTIMGYAGITGPTDVQPNSDPYFHFFTIEQVTAHVASRTCDVEAGLTQATPTANAGADYTIPSGTAFKLTGAGTVDGAGAISYCWEQSDIGGPGNTHPSSTDTSGPSFRSLDPTISPTRYFPNLPMVMGGSLGVAGTPGDWEVINTVSRDYTFRLTVRDNIAGGGQNKIDDMAVAVDDTNGAFTVTSQTTASNWNAGSSETITWNVAGTNAGAVNSPNVNILFTDDNGVTFTTLLANTPNDGSQSIVAPLITTSIGRVVVESANNIFYAVNSGAITIQTAEFAMIFADSSMDVCVPTDAVYNFTYNTFLGYVGSTTFSTTGHPAGSNVVFSPASATADGTPVTMTVTSITGAAVGQSNITVTGTGTPATVTFDSQVVLNVYDGSIVVPSLTTPVDSAVGVAFPYTLTWVADSNAASYDVEVATDATFTTIVDTGSVTTNQYNPSGLSPTTQYYWRVRAVNTCATTAYSTEWNFTTEDCTLCPSVANTDYATSTTRVVFNTIDNASGKPSGYSDYTAISTDVLINNSYNLTVNANTDGAFTTKTIVWIDWNQNCVFDVPSEEYDLGDAFDTVDGATDLSALSITVPAGALTGNTIMRVTTKFKSDGLQTSCENDADAEVEDYTINVISPVPDYAVTATNSPIALCNSVASAVFNYDFTIVNGYSANTTLAVTSALPAGANAVISPTSMNAAGTFTMTVTGLVNFPAGDNTITITATGSDVKTVDVVLNVSAGLPGAPVLTSPADNAVGVALPSVVLTWNAIAGVTSYTVETATDAAFTIGVTTNNVTTNSYTAASLLAGTTYYWRVTATNGCGDSVLSGVRNFETVFDTDNDGILDGVDNCVNTANPGQEDVDGNGIGDACQDTDLDGVLDINDNCPLVANPGQEDVDGNGIGDACQDTDADTILDINDNCPTVANTDQADANGNGVGDVCDDLDNDGVLNAVDNCPTTANPGQEDADGNGIGDVCQDTDLDGILDINDNCVTTANTSQADVDGNGIGDACQDTDSDGVLDIDDNCPLTSNPGQEDVNNDGIGDVCESVEPADTLTPNGDSFNDTWNIKNIDNVSNTVKVFNRHGVKVFDASNYVNNTWGGESTEGGSGLLPSGSYYYVIEYTSTQGEEKVAKGWMYINY